MAEKDRKIAEIYLQLSKYETDNFEAERKINQLMRDNELLEEDVRILKSSVPESEEHEVVQIQGLSVFPLEEVFLSRLVELI